MALPTLESLRERLNLAKGNWRELASISGVAYPTLVKVANGETIDPGYQTVVDLDAGLTKLGAMLSGQRPIPDKQPSAS